MKSLGLVLLLVGTANARPAPADADFAKMTVPSDAPTEHLCVITREVGAGGQHPEITLSYAEHGRITKQVEWREGKPLTTSSFIYDGGKLVGTRDEDQGSVECRPSPARSRCDHCGERRDHPKEQPPAGVGGFVGRTR